MLTVVLVACLADFLRPWARAFAGSSRRSGGLVVLVLIAGLALSAWVTDLLWLFVAVALVFVAAGILAPRLIAWLADWRSGHDRNLQARWRNPDSSFGAS
jgi:putative ABC transport system permease protein